jgi:hypothetical protein
MFFGSARLELSGPKSGMPSELNHGELNESAVCFIVDPNVESVIRYRAAH